MIRSVKISLVVNDHVCAEVVWMYFPINAILILPIRDRQLVKAFIFPMRVASKSISSSTIVPMLGPGPSLMIDIRRRRLEVTLYSYMGYESAM